MKEVIPTAFDLLVEFEHSGNATLIAYLFEEREIRLDKKLTDEQRSHCQIIWDKLLMWQALEQQQGAGAALNLKHERMMDLFNQQPWLKMKFADQIENAEQLAQQALPDRTFSTID